MASPTLYQTFAEDVPALCVYASAPDLCVWVCDPAAVYRPRHPEAQVFYQVFEQHFDSYVAAYEERFEPRSGPLRRVVRDRVEQFLACGRLQGGFARLRRPSCKSEHLVAFSCRTRNFCGSCQAKRAALFAEKLAAEILLPVACRHWTFSIPKAIRDLFERERRLLGLLSRTAYEAVRRCFQALFCRKDVSPTPGSLIGFSDTWRVRRAARGTRSSPARHRRPEAIPCSDFQRRPLELSAKLTPKLRRCMCVQSGRPMWHESAGEGEYFRGEFIEPAFQPSNPVSLPNKLLISVATSRLSVALEIERPIIRMDATSDKFMNVSLPIHGEPAASLTRT